MTKPQQLGVGAALAAAVACLTLAGAIWGAAAGWTKRDNREDHLQDQIDVLRRITVQEHPEYSPVLYP